MGSSVAGSQDTGPPVSEGGQQGERVKQLGWGVLPKQVWGRAATAWGESQGESYRLRVGREQCWW